MKPIWYYKAMGEELGPFTKAEMQEKVRSGQIATDSFVRNGHVGDWVPALGVNELYGEAIKKPTNRLQSDAAGEMPPVPTKECPWCAEPIAKKAIKCKHCGEIVNQRVKAMQSLPQTGGNSDKKILPALLLLFLFGGIGAHAFYAERRLQGCIYLLGLFTPLILAILGCIVLHEPMLFTLGVFFFGFPMGIFLLSDIIQIISGRYKDGKQNEITSWI